MFRSRTLQLGYLPLIILLFTTCERGYDIPTSPEFDINLVGWYELVEADSLFDGYLFVGLDGIGSEHAVVGFQFQQCEFNFNTIEYTSNERENELWFKGRKYRRRSSELARSPCVYFPDEGMLKVFEVDDVHAMSNGVGYYADEDLFYIKRCLWNRFDGYAVDTVFFKVDPDLIQARMPSDSRSFQDWKTVWAKESDPNYGFPAYIRVRTIDDTTIGSHHLEDVDILDLSGGWSFEGRRLLDELEYRALSLVWYAPRIGSIIQTYVYYTQGFDLFPRDTLNAVIQSFINPLLSEDAQRVSSDLRQIDLNRRRYGDN